uniref:Ionotropic glutamate receptor C-terminal domain-containing protein n=1 Tax=Glossina brevipalpis TaxID=37001 RepID=A0A1A9WSE8_9MUSC
MVVPSSINVIYENEENNVDRIPGTQNLIKQTLITFRNCKHCLVQGDINFELWTQKYVGTVGNLDAKHLDTYLGRERTFIKNTELYPNKLTNLEGRIIRIGSHTYLPYVVTNFVSPGVGNVDAIDSSALKRTVSFMGCEAELIITFCQRHNCHLRAEPYGVDGWGVVYDNGTAEGMFGGLFAQHIEIAIGCIYNWYNDLYEASNVITQSRVKLLTPGPAQYPRWRITIMPFSLELWIFIAFAIILYSLIFHFIKYSGYRSQQIHSTRQIQYNHLQYFLKTFLDVFAVFIQQPSADTSLHRFAPRLCLAALLCATITLENTYSGQLKSILTTPLFTDPVDTMDKWIKTNWKWTAPSEVWITNIIHSDLMKEQILVQKFEMNDYDSLYKATFKDDYGLGIEGLSSGSFAFGKYITAPALEGKIITKDVVYSTMTIATAIRGWPMISLLDQHISQCLETGLYLHWEKKNVFQLLDRHIQDILITLAAGYKPKIPPQKLTVESVSGALRPVIAFILATESEAKDTCPTRDTGPVEAAATSKTDAEAPDPVRPPLEPFRAPPPRTAFRPDLPDTILVVAAPLSDADVPDTAAILAVPGSPSDADTKGKRLLGTPLGFTTNTSSSDEATDISASVPPTLPLVLIGGIAPAIEILMYLTSA